MSGKPLFFGAIPARQLAENTPPERDRVIDFARAISLLMVVVGHAVMGVVAWKSGKPRVGNYLATYSWTQALTWVFQIVPLFFFAGGAANAISWERHLARGGGYAEWIWSRVQRLLRPLWIYLIVMSAVAGVVTATVDTSIAAPLLFIITQLLWFLGAYVLVTGLTPFMRPRDAKNAFVAIGALIFAAGLIDYLRFFANWPKVIGLLNFVIVWSIPAYLGAMRSRGVMKNFSRMFLLAVVLLDLLINSALIHFGPWPLSLVGMPREPITNMAPPSVVLAFHAITLVALISLADSWLRQILKRPFLWRKVCAINFSAMTLYLWHLPVLVGLLALSHAWGLERPTTLDRYGDPHPQGLTYLLASVPFWAAFALGVWAMVRLMWPLEHLHLIWWDWPMGKSDISPRKANWLAGIGVFLVGSSLLALAGTGLGGFPTRIVRYAGVPLSGAGAIALLVVAAGLIRRVGGSRNRPVSTK